jgi:hypothetical protein
VTPALRKDWKRRTEYAFTAVRLGNDQMLTDSAILRLVSGLGFEVHFGLLVLRVDGKFAHARSLSFRIFVECFLSQRFPLEVSLLPRITPSLFMTLYGTLESAPYSLLSLASRKAGIYFLARSVEAQASALPKYVLGNPPEPAFAFGVRSVSIDFALDIEPPMPGRAASFLWGFERPLAVDVCRLMQFS